MENRNATVYFDGQVFRPETVTGLEPNRRYLIAILSEAPPRKESGREIRDANVGPAGGTGNTLPGHGPTLAGEESGPGVCGGPVIGSASDEATATPAPVPSEAPTDPWAFLEKYAGTIDGPADWSTEHDHYLYGTPKRWGGGPE